MDAERREEIAEEAIREAACSDDLSITRMHAARFALRLAIPKGHVVVPVDRLMAWSLLLSYQVTGEGHSPGECDTCDEYWAAMDEIDGLAGKIKEAE